MPTCLSRRIAYRSPGWLSVVLAFVQLCHGEPAQGQSRPQSQPQSRPLTPVHSQPAPRFALGFATYLGGSAGEQAREIIRLPDGSLLVGGQTASDDFPVTTGVLQKKYGGEPAGSGHPGLVSGDCFLTCLSADGSRVLASTFFGGSRQERNVYGMEIDSKGDIVITSLTRSPDLRITPDAFQKTYGGGGNDGVVAALSPDGSRLLYASYLGGSGDDGIRGMTLGPWGGVYLVGETTSPNFPVTDRAFQKTLGGASDGFVVMLVLVSSVVGR